jgi:hypothetical protein
MYAIFPIFVDLRGNSMSAWTSLPCQSMNDSNFFNARYLMLRMCYSCSYPNKYVNDIYPNWNVKEHQMCNSDKSICVRVREKVGECRNYLT